MLLGSWMVGMHESLPPGELQPAVRAKAGAASRVWYILGSDCGLSQAVADCLVANAPRRDRREEVVLIDNVPDMERRLRSAGYPVSAIRQEALTPGIHAEGGPWLALFDATDHLTYSAPYAFARGNAPRVPASFTEFIATLVHSQPQPRG